MWAPAWYDAVERSTGFSAPAAPADHALGDDLRRIADAAQALAQHRIVSAVVTQSR